MTKVYALISAEDAVRVRDKMSDIVFIDPLSGRRVKPHRAHNAPSGGSKKPNCAHYEDLREDEL